MSAATVYVARDAGRAPLYVGCTTKFHRRMREHNALKSWWRDVRHVDRTEWPDLQSGLTEERRLIRTLKPRHNIVTYITHEFGHDCQIPAVLSHEFAGYPAGTPLVITHQSPPNIWLSVRIGGEDRSMCAEWSVIREGASGPWLPSEKQIAGFHGNSYAYHWWKSAAPELLARSS